MRAGSEPTQSWEPEMLNADLIRSARWGELYLFFTSGHPPLVLRLLIINTIFLVFFIIRQSSAKQPLRPVTAYAVQTLLIFANVAVIFQDQWLPLKFSLTTLV